MGRRTVPLIREPVVVELFSADLVDSPDMADGGRTGTDAVADDVDAVEVVLTPAPRDFDEIDFAGA